MKKILVFSIFATFSVLMFPSLSTAQKIADYQTLSDRAFSIANGGHYVVNIDVPSNFVKRNAGSLPILFFKVRRTSGSPTVSVELNGTNVYSSTVPTDGSLMTVYEVVKGTQFDTQGISNFQFRSQGGDIIIGDVVLWYQVDLPR